MVEAICDALENDQNLAVQADTGVGKSIAYLAPTLSALANGKEGPVVLATATLALQRQVLTVDAVAVTDAIKSLTGTRVEAAVLKGWSNYACRYLLEGDPTLGLDEQEELFPDPSSLISADGKTWAKVAKWAAKSRTGDRDDLDVSVPGRLWSKMSVSRRECLGTSCPFYEECFANLARTKAFEADLVVTNHSVLGIAVNSNPEVIPEPSILVIDEAHSLADTVRHQGTVTLTERSLAAVARALRPFSSEAGNNMELAADQFDSALRAAGKGLMRGRGEALGDALVQIGEAARQGRRELRDKEASLAVQLAKSRLDSVLEACEAWERDPAFMITWKTEMDSGEDSLHLAPLRVDDRIAAGLEDVAPTIFASATLELGGTFAPMIQRLGLERSLREYSTIDVGGPFDASKQGILLVPRALPAPGRDGISEEALDLFVELVEAAGGGTLGLFTSHRAANAAVEALRERTDFEVLAQGEDSISSLVERFREVPDSCLIGSRSLWQGVDVRGRACRLVVMDRIPFARPDDPITQALGEAAEKNGAGGFFESSLIPASLLMAQGAGRLLRSSEDRGVVAVLDQRLLTRSYGKFLLQSMPKFWRTDVPKVASDALRRLADYTDEETDN